MRKIVLLGGGGHCKACIDVIEATRLFEVSGIVDNRLILDGIDYPRLCNDEELLEHLNRESCYFVTVGQIKTATLRQKLYAQLRALKVDIPIIKSPFAYVSEKCEIGSGTIIMHQALVNARSQIGENCIINSQSLIEHDVVVESNCHISTGAKLNGGVLVGANSFIGSGAIIREGVQIMSDSIVAAGQVILNNYP
jgi:sugar O-acyltransferase (sialic acid O-acetyltransferase NeuD family)